MSAGLQHGHWKNFTTASGGGGEKNQLCDQNWQDKTIDGGGAGQSRCKFGKLLDCGIK